MNSLKKTISTLLVFPVLALLPSGCARILEPEDEEELPVFTLVVETGETNESDEAESPPVYEETETVQFPDPIPIYRPFEPKPGNVVMVSPTGYSTVIITETCIWKIPDTFLSRFYSELSQFTPYEVGQLFEPFRMMDTIENIYKLIEDSHILTTDQTLYYLDFENGEVVRQLDNVTSIYYFPMGVMFWLRYARTEDGSVWRVDEVEPERLADDDEMTYRLRAPSDLGDRITICVLEQWFDDVRAVSWEYVLTEDNVLWQFRNWWEADAVPEKIMEDVRSLSSPGEIVTMDNELWRFPGDSDLPFFIMDNVKSIDNGLIIMTNNELWGYFYWVEGREPFHIMDDVLSVQGWFGFITLDNTLWWIPSLRDIEFGYQEPIRIKENVLRTRWLGYTELIITTDGSLWLFDKENHFFVQLFQG